MNDIITNSALLGMDICSEIDVPVAYHNSSMPYYPLTGPVSFGMTKFKRDKNLKMYQIEVSSAGYDHSVLFSVVGPKPERSFDMNLALGLGSKAGMIGLMIGRERKGVALSYR